MLLFLLALKSGELDFGVGDMSNLKLDSYPGKVMSTSFPAVESFRTGSPHMFTMSSDIQLWKRPRKQNKEQSTTKKTKRGISRNEAV